MSPKTHYIKCPHCQATMEIEDGTGKIKSHWEPGRMERPAAERLEEAFGKMEADKKKRENLFSSAKDIIEGKKKKADDLFAEQLKKIRKEGIGEKPINPLDLD